MAGTLHIVGTPIGNLGDISARAIDTLKTVKAIAAEDTGHVQRLLKRFDIHVKTVSFREENRDHALGVVVDLLAEGDVALVTDAGMPCVSDPGAHLVAGVRAAGFKVRVVPGPSACDSAFSLSGFASNGFVFLGFPPRERAAKMEIISKASNIMLPVIMYESPNRVRKTLEDARDALGDVEVVLARELTKIYEEVVSGRITEVLSTLPPEPLGEFVVVLRPEPKNDTPDIEAVRREIERAIGEGRGLKEISKMVSAVYGMGSKDAYSLALSIKDEKALDEPG